jgi:hypothetical protein
MDTPSTSSSSSSVKWQTNWTKCCLYQQKKKEDPKSPPSSYTIKAGVHKYCQNEHRKGLVMKPHLMHLKVEQKFQGEALLHLNVSYVRNVINHLNLDML